MMLNVAGCLFMTGIALAQQVPVHKPQDAAEALAVRAKAAADAIVALPARIKKLEQSHQTYGTALQEIQPTADRYFVEHYLVLASPTGGAFGQLMRRPQNGDASANLQIEGPNLPADALEAMSRVLWNPEPLRSRWLDIRSRADAVDFQPQKEAAKQLAKQRKRFDDIEPDWRAWAELVRTDKAKRAALEALVQEIDAARAPLETWAENLETTIAKDLQSIAGMNDAVQCREKAVAAFVERKITTVLAWHDGLAAEVDLNSRHGYAMKTRRSLFEQDMAWLDWWMPGAPTGPMQGWVGDKYTWPVCTELYRAAKDFEFWYAWATDERWYTGSDRRLDPAKWPHDDAKTKALHAEFARVVTWQHYVLQWQAEPGNAPATATPPPAIMSETDWRDMATAPIGQEYESWTGVAAQFFNHLSLYFGPPVDSRKLAAETGQRIPTGPKAQPGKLLPPLPDDSKKGRDDADRAKAATAKRDLDKTLKPQASDEDGEARKARIDGKKDTAEELRSSVDLAKAQQQVQVHRELAATCDRVLLALTEVERLQATWKQRLDALAANKDGREVAADVGLVEQFVTATTVQAPSAIDIAAIRGRLEAARNRSLASAADTSVAVSPAPEVSKDVEDTGLLVRRHSELLSKANLVLDTLIEMAKADNKPAADRTLGEVLKTTAQDKERARLAALDVVRREEDQKRIEGERAEVRDALAKKNEAELAALRQKHELELKEMEETAKRERATKEAEIAARAKELDDAKRKLEQETAAKAAENASALEKAKAEAEEKRLVEKAKNAEVQAALQPFLGDGYWQPTARKGTTTGTKQPMSYSALATAGALTPGDAGLKNLLRVGAHKDNDRSRWGMTYHQENTLGRLSAEEKQLLNKAQGYLIELGPTLLKLGLLSK